MCNNLGESNSVTQIRKSAKKGKSTILRNLSGLKRQVIVCPSVQFLLVHVAIRVISIYNVMHQLPKGGAMEYVTYVKGGAMEQKMEYRELPLTYVT